MLKTIWLRLETAILVGFACASTVRAETAIYRATFDMTWSSATHQAPPGPHFSAPIGATHNHQVHFWEPGQLASRGIQLMAEQGAQGPLETEINAAKKAGTAESVIKSCCGFNSPGIREDTFSVTEDYSLVTLVTMVAPSPDWFVGVHNLDLRGADSGQWIGKLQVDLLPYDAGTDDGSTFGSPDLPASPHAPIARITTDPFPTNVPLGTLTFLRLLDGDVSQDGELTVADIDQLAVALRSGLNDPRYDLNQDQLVDPSDYSHWVHAIRHTVFGDANLDGEFDQSDLIDVFVAGQYEDSSAGNSTWSTGDWDGDGDFLSADLIMALADGGYQSSNTLQSTPSNVLPEPSSALLACVGALALCRFRRRFPSPCPLPHAGEGS